jgi:hypothetical protein
MNVEEGFEQIKFHQLHNMQKLLNVLNSGQWQVKNTLKFDCKQAAQNNVKICLHQQY